MTGRTLLVTNDFPPRPGGIQHFVYNLVTRQPPESIVVLASTWHDPAPFDRQQPFEVHRERTSVLLPTPKVARRAAEIVRTYDIDTVWFGAAAPLGLLASGLHKRTAVRRTLALTHGHEPGWAALPGARALLRKIARNVDMMTYLGNYTLSRLSPAIGGLTRLEQLAPGVDLNEFSPSVSGHAIRARHGLLDRPVVVCVSRLVPRKGQDTLIRALPVIRSSIPDAALLLVGDGPYRRSLERLAGHLGVSKHVVFTGIVPWAKVPQHFAAGDVFAMPCRTRMSGLDIEGLGMVFLEASATGLPVVAGDSGGAPDAVLDGTTGYVVSGRSVPDVASRITALLQNPALARAMGDQGRRWVDERWRWEIQADRLHSLLNT